MVGDLTPSSAITQEYAKADPIYVEKTIVSTTAAHSIKIPGALCASFPQAFPPGPFPASPPSPRPLVFRQQIDATEMTGWPAVTSSVELYHTRLALTSLCQPLWTEPSSAVFPLPPYPRRWKLWVER